MEKVSSLLRFKCGIYCITNLVNGKKYIGSSVDIYLRFHDHLHNLKNNISHNLHLQNSWNKYGEHCFSFSLIEYCNKENRFLRELYYINLFKPEFNLTFNVIANFGHTPSELTRKKISDTLKRKYASGEISTYRQDHNWIKCRIYDIFNYKLIKEYNNIAEALRSLNYKSKSTKELLKYRIKNKYCIIFLNMFNKSELELKNFISKLYKKYSFNPIKYLIAEDDLGNIYYFLSTTQCFKFTGVSRAMIFKHQDATRDNPYKSSKSKYKIYFSTEYIDIKNAVLNEESSKLLQTNIGKN